MCDVVSVSMIEKHSSRRGRAMAVHERWYHYSRPESCHGAVPVLLLTRLIDTLVRARQGRGEGTDLYGVQRRCARQVLHH